MLIDDLCFDGEEGRISADAGAEMTADMAEKWRRLERFRHAREGNQMDDIRTARLAKLLSVANRLNAVENDVKQLWMSAENDAERLELLLARVENAAAWADRCHGLYEKEAANG